MVIFEATPLTQSQRLLANTLGYPSSWHVVRVVKGEGSTQTFYDTIYAGKPEANSDTYYNHLAAMDAAMKWKEGESTPYDDNGGQMLPVDQSVEIIDGDEVEVYYDPDDAWYGALVKKVVHYKDDVRYSVKYKADRSTQDNICVENIRLLKAGKKSRTKAGKAKKVTTPKAKISKAKSAAASNSKKRKTAKSSATKAKKKRIEKVEYIPDAKGLHLAADMGLPENWTADARSKSRFVFLSPDGAKRFTSKTSVFAYLDNLEPPTPFIDEQDEETPVEPKVEEDDPPWRTGGHSFLQKRVKYEASKGEYAFGTVAAWISADDVDSEGNPGFLSEKDGKPAALFHITFDANSAFASQDLEEFELMDTFIEEKEQID